MIFMQIFVIFASIIAGFAAFYLARKRLLNIRKKEKNRFQKVLPRLRLILNLSRSANAADEIPSTKMAVVHPQVPPANAMPELTGKWEDTKELLGKIIQNLPLEEKLLKRPPFRYLHDIILAVNQETNFFDGLYNGDEMNPLTLKEKKGVERWRWKMMILLKAITTVNHFYNTSLEVHPRKIIAGAEGHLTNKFLQAVAHAALSGINSDMYVQRTLSGVTGMAISYRMLEKQPVGEEGT